MLLKIDRTGSKPIYQQLIHEIENLIDQGTLEVGQSLPSTRSLADKLGINRSTVTRAYEELQALGYLYSRQGSYHKVESRRKVASYHPESRSAIPWDKILSAGAGPPQYGERERMMLLGLKKGIIYGPVNSRRLGRSLGINILPWEKKTCPFNCVYCQYGWTECHTKKMPSHLFIPTVEEVKKSLEEAMARMEDPPAYITFSGNGEPTTHPDFAAMVDEVIKIRDRLDRSMRTAILSNSALVSEKSIRKSLEKIDFKIMKLDCGNPQVFQRYNQPCSGVDLEGITRGLEKLSGITIQTLLTAGETGNLDRKNIDEWLVRLQRIRPRTVQLYTLDRSYPDKKLKHAPWIELVLVKERVNKAGLDAEIF